MKKLAVAVALSVIAVTSSAVALEPSSASQLVTLRAQTGTGFLPCKNAGNHFVEVFSNATLASVPYLVSRGNVFVATSFQWDMGSATPGESALAAVTIQDGSDTVGVVFSSAIPGSAGDGGGSETMPTGIRFAPGVEHSLCFFLAQGAGTLSGTANLHGFVVKGR